jgi:hypothetical protein
MPFRFLSILPTIAFSKDAFPNGRHSCQPDQIIQPAKAGQVPIAYVFLA